MRRLTIVSVACPNRPLTETALATDRHGFDHSLDCHSKNLDLLLAA